MKLAKIITIIFLFVLSLTSCQKNPAFQEPTATPLLTTLTPLADFTPTPQGTPIPQGVKINQIQGAAHRSPLDGKTVENVYGIVTAKRGDGFYMQDPDPDDNVATSEGIFVAIRGVPRMQIGDAILVKTASVREFNPAGIGENSLTITQLVTSEYEIISSGNPIPEPTVIGKEGRLPPNEIIDNDIKGFAGRNGSFDPEEDGLDLYESLESMRVQVNNAVAVSATNGYNEIAILPDLGENFGLLSSRGTIVLRKNDANPERILLDDSLVNLPKVVVGDQFSQPIIGILDYTFGAYKLQPTHKLPVTPGGLERIPLNNDPLEGQLSVATYNVENLDAFDNPKRIATLAEHIIIYLKSPDIIGFQEIQDNDGEVDSLEVSADETYNKIITAIQQMGGPEYQYLNIDPIRNRDGGAPGGNIRVGILYRSDRGLAFDGGMPGDAETAVQVLQDGKLAKLSLNPGRVDPNSFAFRDSRKPLAAQFSFNGQRLFVVVNHLNSKGGDGPLFGDVQPPNLDSERQRTEQAKVLNMFVKQIMAIDPQANVIVMGDLNDFQWSNPLMTLQGKELSNLIVTLPANEQYTYIYEGNGQVLDHILVSNQLLSKFASIEIVHLNSEYYYMDRLGDHDPVVAIFDLN